MRVYNNHGWHFREHFIENPYHNPITRFCSFFLFNGGGNSNTRSLSHVPRSIQLKSSGKLGFKPRQSGVKTEAGS